MAKKILIVEDNLYTAEDMYIDISFALKKQNINHVELIIANSIDEANDKLKEIEKDDLICIIADLNMNPDGLTDAQRKRTQGAVLTGWVWVSSCVWQKADFQGKQIFFYSAFTNILNNNSEYKALEHKLKRNIKLVNKGECDIDELCKEIIVLCM